VKLKRGRGVSGQIPSKIHAGLVPGEVESAPTIPLCVGWMMASVLGMAQMVGESVGLYCGFWAELEYY
jgi:hypothetical protein